MYCPLNCPTFLKLAQPVNGFYANFRALSRLFLMAKGRQKGVAKGKMGLLEPGVGQNSEAQAWAPKNEP